MIRTMPHLPQAPPLSNVVPARTTPKVRPEPPVTDKSGMLWQPAIELDEQGK